MEAPRKKVHRASPSSGLSCPLKQKRRALKGLVHGENGYENERFDVQSLRQDVLVVLDDLPDLEVQSRLSDPYSYKSDSTYHLNSFQC